MNKHSLFTSNFKKNCFFIIKLIVLFLLLLGYIYWILPQFENGYNASLIDKVDRLESIEEPKIVLLGNSNLAFGINSQLIEEAVGMPVVNMGGHGSNGNAFHEEMAKYNVTQGDIYILCHTSFNDNNTTGSMTTWSSIENHFNLWKILRKDDIGTMARKFPIYLKRCLDLHSSGTGNQDPGGVYARSAFNEYGDVAVLRKGSTYTFKDTVTPPGIGDITIDRINKLNDYITSRGATLLVAGYPIGNGDKTVDTTEFITFQEKLSARLDCPVISNYVDYMFDYKYFYNTEFHLNSEGGDIRTSQLIADIKRWQETGSDASMDLDEYTDIVSDVGLSHISNIYDYLDALKEAKDRYTIFISVKDDASGAMNNEIISGLKDLGLDAELSSGLKNSYAAVIEQGQVIYENLENEKIEISGEFDDGLMSYSVTSGGLDRGSCSSVIINEEEYSENMRGLNFVIYSNETHRILDEVTFDTCDSELTVTR